MKLWRWQAVIQAETRHRREKRLLPLLWELRALGRLRTGSTNGWGGTGHGKDSSLSTASLLLRPCSWLSTHLLLPSPCTRQPGSALGPPSFPPISPFPHPAKAGPCSVLAPAKLTACTVLCPFAVPDLQGLQSPPQDGTGSPPSAQAHETGTFPSETAFSAGSCGQHSLSD